MSAYCPTTPIEETDWTIVVCGCPEPSVRDRVCLICQLPNLAALIAWQGTWCSCEVPDIAGPGGLVMRTCGTCGQPHPITLGLREANLNDTLRL